MNKLYFISQEYQNINHIDSIIKACKAGVKFVQLRIKDKSKDEVRKISKLAKKICNHYRAKLIINDYPYIANTIQADGVHLGKEDTAIEISHKILKKRMLIGATANTFEDVYQYYKNKVDYIGLGPFRFTKTKKNLSPILGLDGYSKILRKCAKKNIDIPIFAIGGIEIKDIANLLNIGLFGIAVSSLIVLSQDPKKIVANIQQIFKKYHQENLCYK